MRTRRFVVRGDLRPGATIALDDDTAHHLVDVLRCRVGDIVEVFDGDGTGYRATLVGTGPATVRVEERLKSSSESPCEITLYQAIPRGDRFELVLEKTAELGVANVIPLQTSRSVVKIDTRKVDSKLARWRRVLESAAQQCGRAVVPSVCAPLTFEEAIATEPAELEVMLHPGAAGILADVVDENALDVALWIGPEGGFDQDEVAALRSRAHSVRLGPRVLRSETAGIVAVASVQLLTRGLE